MRWIAKQFNKLDDNAQVWVVLIIVILVGLMALLAIPIGFALS